MTQKRGLGRGLGALIPGAGAPAGSEQELRTRTHPRTEPEPGEKGSSARPVDMFFSGDPVEHDESDASGRQRRSRPDLAGDMARAAAARRGRGRSSTSTASSSATSDDAKASADAEPSTPTKASSTASSAKKSSSTSSTASKRSSSKGTRSSKDASASTRATSTKRASSKATEPKETTSSKDTSASRRSSSSKRGSSQGASASRGTSASSGAASPRDSSASASSEATPTDSPVVDVERVEPTPVTASRTPAVAEESAAAREDVTTLDAPTDDASQLHEQESSGLVQVPGAEFAEIPIQEIRENPRNPRTMFDDDELDELAFSLREVGVLQPVVVRPITATANGESFELVMGERRWRAAQRAGLRSIPAIIRETSDDDLLRDALLENLHRSQLNPLEEAAAYQQLLDDFGCTQDELADRIGRSRPQITNTLRLMRLPALVQRRLASGALTAGHARALLALDDVTLMEELAQRIVAEGLSVRAVERLVSRGTQPATSRTPRRSTYDPHVVDITSRLSKSLEAPVRIDVGKRKGRITLEFTSIEDLERLVERIGLDLDDLTGVSDPAD